MANAKPKGVSREAVQKSVEIRKVRMEAEAPRLVAFCSAFESSMRIRMKALGLNAEDVGKALNLGEPTISSIRTGASLATILKVAGALGINVSSIIEAELDYSAEKEALTAAVERKAGSIDDQIKEAEAKLKALQEQKTMRKRVLQQVAV